MFFSLIIIIYNTIKQTCSLYPLKMGFTLLSYFSIHSTNALYSPSFQLSYQDSSNPVGLSKLQNSSNINREKHIIDIQKYVLEQALLFEPITDHVGILISNKIQNYNPGVINIRNSESWHWSELVVSN